ncbi:class I SAM-dependent methyltransferase [Pseudonocardia sp. CA-107938]|uniref:class I SAM-dependent methyltransferase n=1 Tax=Pseudonocardia sp. CA-107938 TaxID=3240021 RepID=UPI003D90F011
MADRLVDTGRFLREFIRDPLHTAAVAPSSPALAAAMTATVPVDGAPTVVELGPGTGAFTAAIAARTAGRGRHIAIELHPEWATLLQERFPHVEVVRGDVRELDDILADRRVPPADAVVSGLPWAAYTGVVPLHAAIGRALAPEGAFTQFAYSWTRHWAPPARAQLADLRRHFAQVEIGRTVWRNVPPAVVYTARRRRDGR